MKNTILAMLFLWMPALVSADTLNTASTSLDEILKVYPDAMVSEIYPNSSDTPIRLYEEIRGVLLIRAKASSRGNRNQNYICGYNYKKDNVGFFKTTCLPIY